MQDGSEAATLQANVACLVGSQLKLSAKGQPDAAV